MGFLCGTLPKAFVKSKIARINILPLHPVVQLCHQQLQLAAFQWTYELRSCAGCCSEWISFCILHNMVGNDVFKNCTSHNSQQSRAIVGCLILVPFLSHQLNIHFSPDSRDFTSVNRCLNMLVIYGTMSSTASFKKPR